MLAAGSEGSEHSREAEHYYLQITEMKLLCTGGIVRDDLTVPFQKILVRDKPVQSDRTACVKLSC